MNSVTIGQGVEAEQVDDAEGSPELPVALQDQPACPTPVTAPSRSHHLLVQIKGQGPAVAGSTTCWCRSSGRPACTCRRPPRRLCPTIHDQARADDPPNRVRSRTSRSGCAGRSVAACDGAQRTLDVAFVGTVQDGAGAVRVRWSMKTPKHMRLAPMQAPRESGRARSQAARQCGDVVQQRTPLRRPNPVAAQEPAYSIADRGPRVGAKDAGGQLWPGLITPHPLWGWARSWRATRGPDAISQVSINGSVKPVHT